MKTWHAMHIPFALFLLQTQTLNQLAWWVGRQLEWELTMLVQDTNTESMSTGIQGIQNTKLIKEKKMH